MPIRVPSSYSSLTRLPSHSATRRKKKTEMMRRKLVIENLVRLAKQQQEAPDIQPSTVEKGLDFEIYYNARIEELVDDLAKVFVPLFPDESTKAFVKSCYGGMSWHDVWANATAYVVKMFLSHSDTNAFLGRGQMHCLSSRHFAELIGRIEPLQPEEYIAKIMKKGAAAAAAAKNDESDKDSSAAAASSSPSSSLPAATALNEVLHTRRGRLLDVGAGDGNVTRMYESMFEEIVATEASHQNCLRLAQMGSQIKVIETFGVTKEDLAPHADEPFEVVSCLNLLDRCDRPAKMLSDMRDRLNPRNGVIVLAIVLPYCAFVENGPGGAQRQPIGALDMPKGCDCGGGERMSWEESVNAMYERVIRPLGFKVKRLARVPYLSRGDFHQPMYVLDDAVFVLQKEEIGM